MASNQVLRLKNARVDGGLPQAEDWSLEDEPMPSVNDGEFRVKVVFISVDPYLRGRIKEATVGEPTASGCAGEVVESKNANFAVGDRVMGLWPWRRFVVCTTATKVPYPDTLPLSLSLGVLGMPGFTAWSGLKFACQFKEGDVVLVSAAAGAVGSAVGQLAKLWGASRVVGTAGGADKCKYVTEELGFDACIDYKAHATTESLRAAMVEAFPDGIDCHFDNVGGDVSDIAFDLMNRFGRVGICGQIAMYNMTEAERVGPRHLHKMIYKSINVRGFVQYEYSDKQADFAAEMGELVLSSKVTYRETVVDGFENVPVAFQGLFTGLNTGKLVVKV